jgi:acyl carrier protein
MSELISETVRDIVSRKLEVRLSEELDNYVITKDKRLFADIIDEVEEELHIFIGDGYLEDIETCGDLMDVCEEIEAQKAEQRNKNG